MRVTASVWLGVPLLLAALGTRGAVVAAPPAATPVVTPVVLPLCGVPQAPRNVDRNTAPYCALTTQSTVVNLSSDQKSVQFRSTPGGCLSHLVLCGQHYHAPVENVQGCANERNLLPRSEPTPPAGQWIEVHNVYAPETKKTGWDRPGACEWEKLDCCVGHPILVLGFSTTVSGGSANGPILQPLPLLPAAQFWGSNTGVDLSTDPTYPCKPIAAAWSFRLTCTAAQITRNQLMTHLRGGAQGARPLQGGRRISEGMMLAQPPPSR